jgi:hypothetical protein
MPAHAVHSARASLRRSTLTATSRTRTPRQPKAARTRRSDSKPSHYFRAGALIAVPIMLIRAHASAMTTLKPYALLSHAAPKKLSSPATRSGHTGAVTGKTTSVTKVRLWVLMLALHLP